MTGFRQFSTIAILVSIGLGVALYRAVRTGTEPDAAPGPLAASRPAAIAESSELAQLQREVTELRHLVRSSVQRLAADSPVIAAPIQAPSSGPEDLAEQARRHHEYVAGVEASFRKEDRDPRWSTEASAAIRTALAASQELHPLVGGIECRSQTCRVELTDDASRVVGRQLPMLAMQVGQALPSMVADRVEDGNGRGTMVLYFSRGGEVASSP